MSELAQVLRHVPLPRDPALLVGTETRDDAAVVRLGKHALVFTTDFFAPVVDDPYAYGRIAATNALSDVYAMGGTPLVALNILAFPCGGLPGRMLGKILDGGAAACAEAGAALAGGHTVDDPEPKYGLAVVGTVDPRRFWRNVGARAGDALVLTKPLGVGVVTTAIKRKQARAAETAAAIASMSTLNAAAARALASLGTSVHAVTDVTGYGLLGHLLEMLEGSKVGARLQFGAIRWLPGTRRLAALDCFSGGSKANLAAARKRLRMHPSFGDDRVAPLLLADAQTSGGLLAAVAAGREKKALAALAKAGVEATIIGRCEGARPLIRVDP